MGTVLVIISFATIIVLLRKRHLSVLPAGECRHKMTWRIPVPLSFLACRGIVRRFLVRLCKSNNIFLNCQIIRTKNDHKSPHDSDNIAELINRIDKKNRFILLDFKGFITTYCLIFQLYIKFGIIIPLGQRFLFLLFMKTT